MWSCYVANIKLSIKLKGKNPPLINFIAIKRKFVFKLQAITDWSDKNFKDV